MPARDFLVTIAGPAGEDAIVNPLDADFDMLILTLEDGRFKDKDGKETEIRVTDQVLVKRLFLSVVQGRIVNSQNTIREEEAPDHSNAWDR